MESLLLAGGLLLLSLLALVLAKALLFFSGGAAAGKGRGRQLPPSPPASLPIVGHLLYLRGTPLHKSLTRLARRHGDLVFLRLGTRPVLVVSSASAAEQCLVHNDVTFANRPRNMVGKVFGFGYTSIGFTPYGAHWRNLRRTAAMEIMSTQRLNDLAYIRMEEVRSLAREMAADAASDGFDFKRKDLSTTFSALTFDIMMRMVMGVKPERGDPQAVHFKKNFERTSVLVGTIFPGDFIPLMKFLDFGRFEKKLVKVRDDGNAYLRKIMDERRRSMSAKEGMDQEEEKVNTSLVDYLIAQQAADPDYYNDDLVFGTLSFMLTAGSDTSSITMQWALALLINHPDALHKVRSEVEALVAAGALVTEQDLPHLPYLQAVIAETLRLYPSLPLLFPHSTSQDCVVDGYDVPADTLVFINTPAIHRDESLWEEAGKFKPERFLDNKELTSKSGNGCKYIPFGAGRRRCPGEGLGLRNTALTLATLVQCFDWRSVDGAEEIDMEEESGFATKKKVPLEVMYKVRELMLPALGL